MAHDGSEDGHAAPLLTPRPESAVPRWWKWNMYPFACATLASMTTVLMGYNLAVMSGAELFIREDLGLTDAQTEVLTGSMNLYMLVPILAAGWAADLLGRRGTLLLASAFLVAGALSMSLGRSYAALMAARFVTSVGVGLSLVVAPVYNAEISPASTRGVLSSLLDIFINVGILLGYVSNYAFADLPVHLGWRVMYAAGVLPPVLLAAGVLAMPESPRWLAMRGRYAHARAVLSRTSDTPAEADLRLEEIKRAVSVTVVPRSRDDSGAWTELLVRPSAFVRRILICVVGLQFFQEASGIEAVVLYSPLVFKRAGMSSSDRAALGATVAVGAVKTLSILVATSLSDRLGRRPLLLASTGGVAVAMASLAASLRLGATSACLASMLAFVVAFSVGFGPLVPAYGAEILPLRLRAQGTSVGTAVGRLVCAAVSMTFISLAGAITMPGCFLLYAGVAAAAFVFVYTRLPETRGRSLEDMEVLFAK
ncbi:polyol transporter 5-like [Miscanthus floridulus]|uniref:polyol transporter 5-like n=1 Tax=Miscanthus floridulus TaxID=154761 RepID=UPI003457C911